MTATPPPSAALHRPPSPTGRLLQLAGGVLLGAGFWLALWVLESTGWLDALVLHLELTRFA